MNTPKSFLEELVEKAGRISEEIPVFWTSPKLLNINFGKFQSFDKQERICTDLSVNQIPGKDFWFMGIWQENIRSLTRFVKLRALEGKPALKSDRQILANSGTHRLPLNSRYSWPCGHHPTNQAIPLQNSGIWTYLILY